MTVAALGRKGLLFAGVGMDGADLVRIDLEEILGEGRQLIGHEVDVFNNTISGVSDRIDTLMYDAVRRIIRVQELTPIQEGLLAAARYVVRRGVLDPEEVTIFGILASQIGAVYQDLTRGWSESDFGNLKNYLIGQEILDMRLAAIQVDENRRDALSDLLSRQILP
ncbi:hypothetical protein COY95_02485, partial [Candidatus Woesearchaeota archaeon CG_4_10_14_0_8_um_filter_47_5]